MSKNSEGYRPLDATDLLGFLADIEPVGAVLGRGPWTADEVGDGNLNQVFIVTSASGAALVVKQALPYLRVAGDGWPLTRERMRHEIAALERYGRLAPGRAPEVIHTDPAMSLVAMEYLAEHEVMRGPLMSGSTFPSFAEHVGNFVADTCFWTSDLALSGPDKKALAVECSNPALCDLQEQFVFTNPFMDSEENQWNPALDAEVAAIRSDGALKRSIAAVKLSYLANPQALLHGDLHTGSIMVTADDTRVIDPEFAFHGPIGYDLGTLFANLVISREAQRVHLKDHELLVASREWIDATIIGVWEAFAARFDELWASAPDTGAFPPAFWDFAGGHDAFAEFRASYLSGVLADSAGHGACEVLRRLMGIVSVPELEAIGDDEERAGVERRLIHIARSWLLGAHDISDVEGLVRGSHPVLGHDNPDGGAHR